MTIPVIYLALVAGLVLSSIAIAACALRYSGNAAWFGTYLCEHHKRRSPGRGRPVHVLLCIADHFEPKADRVSHEMAAERVRSWVEQYPQVLGQFRDSDDRPPRHTFFYPIEQYEPRFLDALAGLCQHGYGEVEIHLHHDRDNAQRMRRALLTFKELLADRHGLMARSAETGEVSYAFVHGNWALDNCLHSGRWCGVNNELDILRETGCYADFTLPSVPEPAQTRKINSIYYAVDDPSRPKSHDWGVDVGSNPRPDRALLLIQGPLLLNWKSRKWGVLPRLENACLQGSQPPSIERLDLWLKARIQVRSRPDWFFVKLHTHGTGQANQRALLGDQMIRFHEALAERAARQSEFHYHYVTAREMANLVHAAEAGWEGSVADARDFAFLPPTFSTLVASSVQSGTSR